MRDISSIDKVEGKQRQCSLENNEPSLQCSSRQLKQRELRIALSQNTHLIIFTNNFRKVQKSFVLVGSKQYNSPLQSELTSLIEDSLSAFEDNILISKKIQNNYYYSKQKGFTRKQYELLGGGCYGSKEVNDPSLPENLKRMTTVNQKNQPIQQRDTSFQTGFEDLLRHIKLIVQAGTLQPVEIFSLRRKCKQLINFNCDNWLISSQREYKTQIFQIIEIQKDCLLLLLGVGMNKRQFNRSFVKEVESVKLSEIFYNFLLENKQSKFLSDVYFELELLQKMETGLIEIIESDMEVISDIQQAFQFQIAYERKNNYNRIVLIRQIKDQIDSFPQINELIKHLQLKLKIWILEADGVADINMFEQFTRDETFSKDKSRVIQILNRFSLSYMIAVSTQNQNKKELGASNDIVCSFVKQAIAIGKKQSAEETSKKDYLFLTVQQYWSQDIDMQVIIVKILEQIFEVFRINEEESDELFDELCIFCYFTQISNQELKNDEVKLVIDTNPSMKNLLESRNKDPKLLKQIKEIYGNVVAPKSLNQTLTLIQTITMNIDCNTRLTISDGVQDMLKFEINRIAGRSIYFIDKEKASEHSAIAAEPRKRTNYYGILSSSDPSTSTQEQKQLNSVVFEQLNSESQLLVEQKDDLRPELLILNHFVKKGNIKVLILGGQHGSGKSTIFKRIIDNLQKEKSIQDLMKQPLVFYFKQNYLYQQNPSIDDILHKIPYNFQHEQVQMIKDHESPKLIIIDGFEDLKSRLDTIKKLFSSLDSWRNTQVIISSCETGKELREIDWFQIMGQNRFSIQELSTSLIIKHNDKQPLLSLKNYTDNLIKKVGWFRISSLYSNPANLYMLQKIANFNGFNQDKYIFQDHDLIKEFVEVSLDLEIAKAQDIEVDSIFQLKRDCISQLETLAFRIFTRYQGKTINDDNSLQFDITGTKEIDIIKGANLLEICVKDGLIFCEKKEFKQFSLNMVYEYFLASALFKQFEQQNDIARMPLKQLESFPINIRPIISKNFKAREGRVLKMVNRIHFSDDDNTNKIKNISEYLKRAQESVTDKSQLSIGVANIVSALLLGKKRIPIIFRDLSNLLLTQAYLNDCRHNYLLYKDFYLGDQFVNRSVFQKLDSKQEHNKIQGFDSRFDSDRMFPVDSVVYRPKTNSIYTNSNGWVHQYVISKTLLDEQFELKNYAYVSDGCSNFWLRGDNLFCQASQLYQIDPITLSATILPFGDISKCNIQTTSINFEGTLAALSFGQVLNVCNITGFDQNKVQPSFTFKQHITNIAFSNSKYNFLAVTFKKNKKEITIVKIDLDKNTITEFYNLNLPYQATFLQFQPEGDYFVVGTSSGSVNIWKIDTQFKLEKTYQVHSEPISYLNFSHCGNYLLCCSDDMRISQCAFNNDFEVTSVSSDNKNKVKMVLFLGDSQHFLSVSEREDLIQIWEFEKDSTSGTRRQEIFNSIYSSNYLSFSPCGRFLAQACPDKKVRIWETSENFVHPRSTISSHDKAITCVEYSPSGKYLATASNDETVIVQEASEPFALYLKLNEHEDSVCSVAFSSDEKYLVTASWDQTFKVIEMAKKEVIFNKQQSHPVLCVKFSPCSRMLASGSVDYSINIWDATDKFQNLQRIDQCKGWVYTLCFSSDSQFLFTGSKENVLRLFAYDIEGNKFAFQKQIDDDSEAITCVAVSPNMKKILSGSRSKILQEIRIKRENQLPIFQLQNRKKFKFPVNSIAVSKDGKNFASGSYQNITLWTKSANKTIKLTKAHSQEILCCAFSKCGLLGTICLDQVFKLWDSKQDFILVSEQRMILKKNSYSQQQQIQIEFSPDSKFVAVLYYQYKEQYNQYLHDFTVWQVQPINLKFATTFNDSSAISISFSSSGKYLAELQTNNKIAIYDVEMNFNLLIEIKAQNEKHCIDFDSYRKFFTGQQFEYRFNMENVSDSGQYSLLSTKQLTFSPDDEQLFVRNEEKFYLSNVKKLIEGRLHKVPSKDGNETKVDELMIFEKLRLRKDDDDTVEKHFTKVNKLKNYGTISYCGRYFATWIRQQNNGEFQIIDLNEITLIEEKDQIVSEEIKAQENEEEVGEEKKVKKINKYTIKNEKGPLYYL